MIDDMQKAMSSNRVRMNWPFAEESVQDGANREMDEEDTKSECDSPDSPTVTDLKAACSGGYRVKIDFIGCPREGVVTSVHDRSFFLRESVCTQEYSHTYCSVLSVERVDSDVAKERWEVSECGQNIVDVRDDGNGFALHCALVKKKNATPEQMRVMVHASWMLDVLEEIVNVLDSQQSWRNHPSLTNPIKRGKAACVKARGG